eukprot:TRINITY_DN12654_c0_g1_i1.p1 TRINITY_DN12654_c0_g1~~TRINITY_DN12654_c0_g1_i1.p1  ORF type:complete len:345 (-),score=117.15 TRINITY_DN12654_c0_g1_i1:284-1231(-)
MAHYCIMHAVQLGLPIMKTLEGEEKTEFTTKMFSLMNQLEEYKRVNGDSGDGCTYATNFANKVFDIADSDDRNGRISRETAMSFFSAVTLYEILKQFYPDGNLPEQIVERQRYAKVKAAYISKCIKNGTPPQPGPLDGQSLPSAPPAFDNSDMPMTDAPRPHESYEFPSVSDKMSFDETPGSNEFSFSDGYSTGYSANQGTGYNANQAAGYSPNHNAGRPSDSNSNSNFQNGGTPNANRNGIQAPTVNFSKPTQQQQQQQRYKPPTSEEERRDEDLHQALKHARFVVSALQFEDVTSALQNCKKVFEILGQYETY